MKDEEKNLPAGEDEEMDDIITLVDEDGRKVNFEFLDLIEYSCESYAVLVPEGDEEDQVVIFKVENADSDNNTFIPITDQDLAMALFELFKEKNADLYDFYE